VAYQKCVACEGRLGLVARVFTPGKRKSGFSSCLYGRHEQFRTPRSSLRIQNSCAHTENPMQEWHDFFVLAGTGAATLLGLLFVALSVNKESIAARPLLRSLARQTFLSFGVVLVVSLLGLVPTRDVSERTIGLCLILGVLGVAVFSATVVWQTLQQNRRMGREPSSERRRDKREYVSRVAIFNAGLGCVFVAGVPLWRGDELGVRWLLPAVILLGALALNNAWGLVLRVDS